MKRKNRKNLSKRIRIVLVLILFIVGVTYIKRSTQADTSQGIQYITKLENKDITSVKKKVMKKRVAEKKEAIKDGDMSVFSLFDDYVFFGDSRVMGFINYDFLDSSRVLSDGGATIKYVSNHLEEVKSLQPSTVILSYGVNDMGMGIDSEEGGYSGVYTKEVKKILDIVPDAKIYVCSIIPCTQEALEKSPAWSNVDKYNSELKKMCKKNNWVYIDTTSLADGGQANIYQEDGIHFLSSFYESWAKVITDSILENEED